MTGERKVRQQLQPYTDETVQRMEEFIKQPFPENIQYILFEIFHGSCEFAVSQWSNLDEDLSWKGVGAALDYPEDESIDTDQIIIDWFSACWDKAGGQALQIPSFVMHHDSDPFDLKTKKWVDFDYVEMDKTEIAEEKLGEYLTQNWRDRLIQKWDQQIQGNPHTDELIPHLRDLSSQERERLAVLLPEIIDSAYELLLILLVNSKSPIDISIETERGKVTNLKEEDVYYRNYHFYPYDWIETYSNERRSLFVQDMYMWQELEED